jgi:predicted nucleic acid-binding protein
VKLLLDINVVLDVLLAREPWAVEAATLLSAVEERRVEGYVAGHTITTVHYIVEKAKGSKIAALSVTDVLRIVRVAPIGATDFHQGLALRMNDFEDAVQVAAALQVGADYLVTRNTKDFRRAPVQVRTPGEILALG